MESEYTYSCLLADRGIPLSLINPGSTEVALYFDDALMALEMHKKNKTIILGGDVLIEKGGELMYVYQLWGNEYIYLNWYFKPNQNNLSDCYMASHEAALKNLCEIKKISDQFKTTCLIVFVI